MNVFKKIVLAFFTVLALTLIVGYIYFHNKFTPPENNLTVSGQSENIPLRWSSSGGNPYSALLLPVKINGVEKEFFMQLDFGSPVTVFYKNSLESINAKSADIFLPDENHDQFSLSFKIGDLLISSQNFRLMDYGKQVNFSDSETENIIGTIGTDLLEKRIAVLDFRNHTCSFVESVPESGFTDFEFKRRRILIPAKLENEKLNLLYDSGTSGYELITSEENWNKLKDPNSKIKTEKGNSWGAELKVISASSSHKIQIGNVQLKLLEVTYVEGTSKMQNLLMKSSGMQGMIGNKLFLNKKLTLDCKNEKFKLE